MDSHRSLGVLEATLRAGRSAWLSLSVWVDSHRSLGVLEVVLRAGRSAWLSLSVWVAIGLWVCYSCIEGW